MRKLLLGLGLLAVGMLIQRRPARGIGRFLSLRALAGTLALNAASQFLYRTPKPAPATVPATRPDDA
jgi:hypothetical protein